MRDLVLTRVRSLIVMAAACCVSSATYGQPDRSGLKPTPCINDAYAEFDKANKQISDASTSITTEGLLLRRRLQEGLCERVSDCVAAQTQNVQAKSMAFEMCLERETLRGYDAVRRP
jgi:hypothetical protein